MILRTFRQYAIGYGATPAQVVCQLAGNTVYSGEVLTLNQPVPSLPNLEYQIDNIAWSWQDDVEFAGTKDLIITVSNSLLLLGLTLANNPAANVETWGAFYSVEVDGIYYADPFTNEAINGVAQGGPYNPDFTGQWWWRIPAGSTFTATMHVQEPPEPEPPEPEPPPA